MSESRAEWLASRPQAGGLGLGDYTASQLYKRLMNYTGRMELHLDGEYRMDLDSWVKFVASGVEIARYREVYPRCMEPKWRPQSSTSKLKNCCLGCDYFSECNPGLEGVVYEV